MMKKKLFSLAVTLVMALSLAVPAMAAEITIENPAPNETYTAYKIFDVTKSDLICGQEAGAGHTHSDNCYSFSYSILTTNPWYDTVVKYANAIDATDADGLTLVPVASDSGKFTVDFDNNKFSAAAFAAALNTANESVTDTGYTSTGGKITVPDAGYYFVDTTLGSLCSLLTSDSSQELVEKNSIPSLTKDVQEDSNGIWGETATAEYGQSVEFRLTVNTGTSNGGGTGVDEDYVITDVIPTNMTLDNNAEEGEDPSYVTLPDGWTKDTDYAESYDAESHTLTITLDAEKVAALGQDHDIVIAYSATLNSSAVVEIAEVNTATLVYKEQTSEDKASVVTYSIDGDSAAITKVDGEGEALAGVKFVLTNAEGKFAKLDTATWKLTGWVEAQEDATELVTDENGKIYADGLDAGTYTLKETETLPGYNLLNDTITATIAENGDVTYKYTSSDDSANTINIVNESGAILPGTGGMGTTIFYVVGGTLVVAAAVLLITKKRMHNVED